MWKLYLKKLWKTLLFAVGYFFTVGCCGFLSYLLVFSILPLQKIVPEDTLTIILAIIALVIMLVLLYRQRCDNKPYKREYLEGIEDKPRSFRKDFWQTLKSKESLAQTLAFITLDFLFGIPGGISASPNLLVFILGTLTKLTVEGTAFTLINTLIWSLVHRRWYDYWQYAGYITDRFEK